jgi:hypothetical protein
VSTFIEQTGGEQFADDQKLRDLRAGPETGDHLDAGHLDDQLEPESQRKFADSGFDSRTGSEGRLEALKQDSGDERYRRIELPGEPQREHGTSGRGHWFNRITWRALLAALLVLALGAIAPSLWNYLQSYESTDDGHIDPLSSRVNGTVIRVRVEDDDRVKAGELLVQIDPRDYQVAVEQAEAGLELALAQVASAKQNYAAALANVREGDAANFKAQRDVKRFTVLLDRQVVAQSEYDQYIATAGVDAAKVDSDREAAGSALKTIVAREADVDAARAALNQALLNLSYTKSTRRPMASSASAAWSWALESNLDRP